MRFSRLVSFGLAPLLISASSLSQQASPTVQRDPQAMAVLQASYSALGAVSQPLPSSLSVAGTYTHFPGASTFSYPTRLMALGTDKIRWETDLPTGTVISIIRGRGGSMQDVDGTSVLSVAEAIGQGVENLPLLALATWANSPNVLVSFIGTETLDGVNAYHLSLTQSRDPNASPDADSEKILRAVSQCDLYVNQQTNLPIRLRYYEHPGDWRRSIPVDLAFSDYRSVGGFLFPFTLTRYRGGRTLSQIQWNSITLNPPLTDALFWVNQP